MRLETPAECRQQRIAEKNDAERWLAWLRAAARTAGELYIPAHAWPWTGSERAQGRPTE
jgi:hypothetical protein